MSFNSDRIKNSFQKCQGVIDNRNASSGDGICREMSFVKNVVPDRIRWLLLALHCLPRKVCLNTSGHCSRSKSCLLQERNAKYRSFYQPKKKNTYSVVCRVLLLVIARFGTVI